MVTPVLRLTFSGEAQLLASQACLHDGPVQAAQPGAPVLSWDR